MARPGGTCDYAVTVCDRRACSGAGPDCSNPVEPPLAARSTRPIIAAQQQILCSVNESALASLMGLPLIYDRTTLSRDTSNQKTYLTAT
jgi:hypothetical protein